MYRPEPIISHERQFREMIPTLPHGPIGEFGVYQGGSTVQLATFGRMVYAFDTFDGMPPDSIETPYDAELDKDNPPGQFKSDRVIEQLAFYPNIQCIKGTFQETCPTFPPEIKFAFVYLDCDWYSAYRYVVEWLADGRLLPGAVALCDDYGHCKGCDKAINEMVAEGLITYEHPWVRWTGRTKTLPSDQGRSIAESIDAVEVRAESVAAPSR